MTQIQFVETDGIGPSARVWKKINCPHGAGFFRTRGEGNPAIGFFDDFLSFDTTSGDKYGKVEEHGATVVQEPSEATAPGMVRLEMDANDEEATLQLGNVLDVGAFRLQKDFAFEARVRVSANGIVENAAGYFVGMATGGASGACVTEQLFAADVLNTSLQLIGFQHLAGETTALDAVYMGNATAIDGSQDTDLNNIQVLAAATWYKLGFAFRATKPRKVEWFVDGAKVCQIEETGVAHANFPDADTAFMQPTIGIRGGSAGAATTLDIDWWACAQLY
jgi:hypothetical protein